MIPCIGLDGLGRLIAVHDRHHDVHQHQIGTLCIIERNRLFPIIRQKYSVPVLSQHHIQHNAVRLIIIDDKYAQRMAILCIPCTLIG